MDRKYSLETQKEISTILANINEWKNLFSIKVDYFYEGWAIYLKEKNLYPRSIVIFKSYTENHYVIKSFEINTSKGRETFKELYMNEDINSLTELYSEIKEIIYGKDILRSISNMKHD